MLNGIATESKPNPAVGFRLRTKVRLKAGLPAQSGEFRNFREVGIAGHDFEVVLERNRSDPEVVVGNHTALATKVGFDSAIYLCRCRIGIDHFALALELLHVGQLSGRGGVEGAVVELAE